jgi:cellulose synthase/poly-beta-1,6-N-acetylglucosamine synthase-like glycosyltransferase
MPEMIVNFPWWAFFAVAGLWHLYYIQRYWWPVMLKGQASAGRKGLLRPLSLIVAARNEAENLRRNIPLWMAQDHPDYEVIVVNDSSWDETGLVLKEFSGVYPRLKIVSVEEQDKYPTGKKFAITLGIKAASHAFLVFSDADCRPASEQWLTMMQGAYKDSTELVLGHVQLERTRGILGWFQQFDALFTNLQCYGHAIVGKAFMGRGGNMSYLRNLFFYHKGFSAHLKHISGDDGLFVNQAATKNNVRVCLQQQAWTYTDTPWSWGAWFRQKRRHASSAAYLRFGHKFRIALYGVTLWMMAVWPALGWLWPWEYSVPWAFLWLYRWGILSWAAMRFKQAGLVPLLPILDLQNLLLRTAWAFSATRPSKASW